MGQQGISEEGSCELEISSSTQEKQNTVNITNIMPGGEADKLTSEHENKESESDILEEVLDAAQVETQVEVLSSVFTDSDAEKDLTKNSELRVKYVYGFDEQLNIQFFDTPFDSQEPSLMILDNTDEAGFAKPEDINNNFIILEDVSETQEPEVVLEEPAEAEQLRQEADEERQREEEVAFALEEEMAEEIEGDSDDTDVSLFLNRGVEEQVYVSTVEIGEAGFTRPKEQPKAPSVRYETDGKQAYSVGTGASTVLGGGNSGY